MNENIDWEGMMSKTEKSATSAAQKAERAVGGVAKVLEIQHHHSQQLVALKQKLDVLVSRQSDHPSPTMPPTDNAQGEAEINFRFLALGVVVVLVAGITLGAYFVS